MAGAHHPFGEFSYDEEERCEVIDGGGRGTEGDLLKGRALQTSVD